MLTTGLSLLEEEKCLHTHDSLCLISASSCCTKQVPTIKSPKVLEDCRTQNRHLNATRSHTYPKSSLAAAKIVDVFPVPGGPQNKRLGSCNSRRLNNSVIQYFVSGYFRGTRNLRRCYHCVFVLQHLHRCLCHNSSMGHNFANKSCV